MLHAYEPTDRQQEALRLRGYLPLAGEYLAFLAEHPDGVWKSGPPEHLTASCLVLDETLGRVLLTHHRRARMWFQFGGHLEPVDRSVRAAAEREATEESVLRAAGDPSAGAPRSPRLVGDFGRCREHLDVRYAATAPAGAEPQASAEPLDVRWWPVNGLPEGHVDELGGLVTAARRAFG